jgi:hypothetical protein
MNKLQYGLKIQAKKKKKEKRKRKCRKSSGQTWNFIWQSNFKHFRFQKE